MKIKMIGSGSMTSNSNSACYLVDDKILIDTPNGIEKAMLRNNYDISDLDAILITHFHADHYFDLPFVLLNIFNKTKRDFSKKLYIICCDEFKSNIKSLIELSNFKSFEEIKEKLNIEIIGVKNRTNIDFISNDYTLECVPVKHMDFSYGYVISENNTNKKVGFSGDSSMCNGVKDIVKRSNISFCDMSLSIGNESHMGIDNIKELLKENEGKSIIATHLREETKKEALDLNINNLIIGKDGFEINI